MITKENPPRRNALRCATWGTLNPITRKTPSPKANNRKKARKRMASPYSVSFCIQNAPVNDRGILYLTVVTAYFMKVPSIICCR